MCAQCEVGSANILACKVQGVSELSVDADAKCIMTRLEPRVKLRLSTVCTPNTVVSGLREMPTGLFNSPLRVGSEGCNTFKPAPEHSDW
jgi:hypothetical protein